MDVHTPTQEEHDAIVKITLMVSASQGNGARPNALQSPQIPLSLHPWPRSVSWLGKGLVRVEFCPSFLLVKPYKL